MLNTNLMYTAHSNFIKFTNFEFKDGSHLDSITLSYETFGTLNTDKSNAILLFHALSGSQHAAGYNPEVEGVGDLWTEECRQGWWDDFIGPEKAINTDKFFVICANYLGGCYGSTGPSSLNPQTQKPYGSSFPHVSASDVVDSQLLLLNHFGIDRLHATIGVSLGGMMAFNLAVRHPERVRIVMPIASAWRPTVLQRIHNFEQIFAIEEDEHFNGGDYYDSAAPDRGLALARMISHKTFISLSFLKNRAHAELVQLSDAPGRYTVTYPIESYLLYQARKFVQRFDANTYLRIMEIWQHFDLEEHGPIVEQLSRCHDQRFMLMSIDSDVCFYPEEQAEMASKLHEADIKCRHVTVHSGKGHDAFLLEPDLFAPQIDYTLNSKW